MGGEGGGGSGGWEGFFVRAAAFDFDPPAPSLPCFSIFNIFVFLSTLDKCCSFVAKRQDDNVTRLGVRW
jgi:hypothetical protein